MNRRALLRQLQALDFALQDTILYLDTHPDDPKALEYYRDIRARAAETRRMFEMLCGPLEAQNAAGRSWEWINMPWPWETGE